MIDINITKEKIFWNSIDIEIGEDYFIYETVYKDNLLRVRVNDFPSEPMYTIFVDSEPRFDIDNFPSTWECSDD